MSPGHLFWVLGALLAAGGCATAPSAPNPILFGRTQPLAVRADLPARPARLRSGARSSVRWRSRRAWRRCRATSSRRCSKTSGRRRESRRSRSHAARTATSSSGGSSAQFVDKVWQEEFALQARPEPTQRRRRRTRLPRGGSRGAVVVVAAPTALGGPLGMALVASGGAVWRRSRHRDRRHHRHPGPAAEGMLRVSAAAELLLVPAKFDSAARARRLLRGSRRRKFAAHEQMRTQINANCWFHPCKPSDAQPVPGPLVQRLRETADADLRAELDGIPAMRAQVRIGWVRS